MIRMLNVIAFPLEDMMMTKSINDMILTSKANEVAYWVMTCSIKVAQDDYLINWYDVTIIWMICNQQIFSELTLFCNIIIE